MADKQENSCSPSKSEISPSHELQNELKKVLERRLRICEGIKEQEEVSNNGFKQLPDTKPPPKPLKYKAKEKWEHADGVAASQGYPAQDQSGTVKVNIAGLGRSVNDLEEQLYSKPTPKPMPKPAANPVKCTDSKETLEQTKTASHECHVDDKPETESEGEIKVPISVNGDKKQQYPKPRPRPKPRLSLAPKPLTCIDKGPVEVTQGCQEESVARSDEALLPSVVAADEINPEKSSGVPKVVDFQREDTCNDDEELDASSPLNTSRTQMGDVTSDERGETDSEMCRYPGPNRTQGPRCDSDIVEYSEQLELEDSYLHNEEALQEDSIKTDVYVEFLNQNGKGPCSNTKDTQRDKRKQNAYENVELTDQQDKTKPISDDKKFIVQPEDKQDLCDNIEFPHQPEKDKHTRANKWWNENYVNVKLPNQQEEEKIQKSKTPLQDKIHLKQGMRTLWVQMHEVSPLLPRLSEPEKRKQEALFEIVTSEVIFLKSLELIISLFENSKYVQEAISQEQHDVIFKNVADIHTASKCLVKRLETLWDEDCVLRPDEVCQVISDTAREHFTCYVTYVENQLLQQEVVRTLRSTNQAFHAVVLELEKDPRCMMLNLETLLMQPVQRITRLPLLLKELIKYVEDESAVLERVADCLSQMEKITKEGEEKADVYQDIVRINQSLVWDKVEDLEPVMIATSTRRLVREMEIKAVAVPALYQTTRCYSQYKTEKSRKLCFLLFSDMLLVTEKDSSEKLQVLNLSPRALVVAKAINHEIASCWMQEKLPSDMTGHVVITILLKNKAKYILAFNQQNQQKAWVNDFQPPKVDSYGHLTYHEYELPEYEAIADYNSDESGALNLQIGDKIQVYRDTNNEFLEGRKMATGESGFFPKHHTRLMDSIYTQAKDLRFQLAAAKEFFGVPTLSPLNRARLVNARTVWYK